MLAFPLRMHSDWTEKVTAATWPVRQEEIFQKFIPISSSYVQLPNHTVISCYSSSRLIIFLTLNRKSFAFIRSRLLLISLPVFTRISYSTLLLVFFFLLQGLYAKDVAQYRTKIRQASKVMKYSNFYKLVPVPILNCFI